MDFISQWQNLTVHDLALRPREATPEELQDIMNDIRDNGYDQRQPIWLIEDQGVWKILEGRNRFKACLLLGVTPTFEKFDPAVHGDPNKFVKRMNAFRRHEKRSDMLAWVTALASLEKHQHKPDAPNGASAQEIPLTQQEAARKAGVGRRTIQRHRKVREQADRTLQEAVAAGTVKVSDAANIAGKALPIQQAAVRAVQAGEAKTVTQAAQAIEEAKALPKSGPSKFDDQLITELVGKLIRAIDARGNALGKTAEYHHCVTAMAGIAATWRQWRSAS